MRHLLFSLTALLAVPLAASAADRPAAPAPHEAARKVLTIPGQRDGPSTFVLTDYPEMRPLQQGAMDFRHYHSTAEINYWMHR
ncbi:MAG: hypothetical protein QM605_15575 [Sphingobium sp.]